jgi:hypothetical protein
MRGVNFIRAAGFLAAIGMLGACERYETVTLSCCSHNVIAKISDQKAVLDITVTEEGSDMSSYYPEFRDANHLKVDLVRKPDESGFSDRVFFAGKIPGGENETGIALRYDHKLKAFDVGDFRHSNNGAWMCNVVTRLPVKIIQPKNLAKVSAKEKSRAESCIDYIMDNAMVVYESNVMKFKIKNNGGEWIEVSQETALELSDNWNFEDMKLYQNNDDGYLFDYELDACETVEKMNRFIADTGQPKDVK